MVAFWKKGNVVGMIVGACLLMLSLSGCMETSAKEADPPTNPRRNAASQKAGPVGRYQIVVSSPSDGSRGIIAKCDTQTGDTWIVYCIAGEPQGSWREVR